MSNQIQLEYNQINCVQIQNPIDRNVAIAYTCSKIDGVYIIYWIVFNLKLLVSFGWLSLWLLIYSYGYYRFRFVSGTFEMMVSLL